MSDTVTLWEPCPKCGDLKCRGEYVIRSTEYDRETDTHSPGPEFPMKIGHPGGREVTLRRVPNVALGEVLHKLFCTYNHIDQCAYHYEGRWADETKKQWREKADIVLAETPWYEMVGVPDE